MNGKIPSIEMNTDRQTEDRVGSGTKESACISHWSTKISLYNEHGHTPKHYCQILA